MTVRTRTALLLASVWTPLIADPVLHCFPEKLHRGDKLTIRGLPENHQGWTFTVSSSHGKGLFVISSLNRRTEKFVSPISPEAFGKMTKVTLDISTAKGVRFDGAKQPKPPALIFDKSDTYEISVGPPLGQEDFDTYTCHVEFFADPETAAGAHPN